MNSTISGFIALCGVYLGGALMNSIPPLSVLLLIYGGFTFARLLTFSENPNQKPKRKRRKR